jgi:hypothetical protein
MTPRLVRYLDFFLSISRSAIRCVVLGVRRLIHDDEEEEEDDDDVDDVSSSADVSSVVS